MKKNATEQDEANALMIFPNTSPASPTLEERNHVLSSRLGATEAPYFVVDKKNHKKG